MRISNRYITLGGHRHRYIDTGGDGPVMLLLHGISSSLDYYGPSIPLLARSFRVLALDLLGFGESDKPQMIPYSLQLYADLIHEFIRKTDASAQGEIYGTGHSMGGKYLLATALLHPGTFGKMVLSNTDGFIILPSFARALSLPGVRHVLKPLVTGQRIAGRMLDSAIHNRQAVDDKTWHKVLEIARDHEAFETLNLPLTQFLKNLKLLTNEHLTLAGLLLYGNNPESLKPQFRIKATYFAGNEISVDQFKDKQEIGGKLIDQYLESIAFIKRNLRRKQVHADFNAPGVLEIPELAFAEIIANAIVHRNYYLSAPIQIIDR